MNLNNESFVICDGYNTSYISSLLMALFYFPSELDNILENECTDKNKMHLQDIIKIYFVNNVRQHISITEEILNEIRNYSYYCGWSGIMNLLNLSDINDYYTFIMQSFEIKTMEFKNTVDLHYTIKLKLKNKSHDIHELLYSWLEKNPMKNAPQIITIYLDRSKQKKSMVDIKKYIQPHKYNVDQHFANITWEIKSIVCYENIYYSLIHNLNKWFLSNEKQIPGIREIDIKNKNIIDDTKKNCVLFIYTIMYQ